MTKTLVTQAGIAATINAGTNGPLFQITSLRVGSDLITPVGTETNVANQVYVGNSAQIRYQILSDSTILFKVTLDETIGDFTMGNIGLFMADGSMFSITALDEQESKTATSSSSNIGNRREFYIIIRLTNIADAIDVSILVADECALPEVNTESELPNAGVAPFNVYLVRTYSVLGRTALACRVSGSWYYIPVYQATATDDSAITAAGMFATGVVEGQAVYLDTTTSPPKLKVMDGTNPDLVPVGIRGLGDRLYINGTIFTFSTSSPYTAGSEHFIGGDGFIRTTTTAQTAGTAISTNQMLVGFATRKRLTVTGGKISIRGSSPDLDLIATGNPLDQKVFQQFVYTDGSFNLRFLNDASNDTRQVVSVTRSGFDIVNFNLFSGSATAGGLPSLTLDVNGNAILNRTGSYFTVQKNSGFSWVGGAAIYDTANNLYLNAKPAQGTTDYLTYDRAAHLWIGYVDGLPSFQFGASSASLFNSNVNTVQFKNNGVFLMQNSGYYHSASDGGLTWDYNGGNGAALWANNTQLSLVPKANVSLNYTYGSDTWNLQTLNAASSISVAPGTITLTSTNVNVPGILSVTGTFNPAGGIALGNNVGVSWASSNASLISNTTQTTLFAKPSAYLAYNYNSRQWALTAEDGAYVYVNTAGVTLSGAAIAINGPTTFNSAISPAAGVSFATGQGLNWNYVGSPGSYLTASNAQLLLNAKPNAYIQYDQSGSNWNIINTNGGFITVGTANVSIGQELTVAAKVHSPFFDVTGTNGTIQLAPNGQIAWSGTGAAAINFYANASGFRLVGNAAVGSYLDFNITNNVLSFWINGTQQAYFANDGFHSNTVHLPSGGGLNWDYPSNLGAYLTVDNTSLLINSKANSYIQYTYSQDKWRICSLGGAAIEVNSTTASIPTLTSASLTITNAINLGNGNLITWNYSGSPGSSIIQNNAQFTIFSKSNNSAYINFAYANNEWNMSTGGTGFYQFQDNNFVLTNANIIVNNDNYVIYMRNNSGITWTYPGAPGALINSNTTQTTFYASSSAWINYTYGNSQWTITPSANVSIYANPSQAGIVNNDIRLYGVATIGYDITQNPGAANQTCLVATGQAQVNYLKVVQDALLSGNTQAQNLTVNGNFTNNSDIRIKKDIVVLSDSLDKLNKINGYKFTKTTDNKTEYGVIAQEIKEIFPELVETVEKYGYDDFLTVKQLSLIAVLIEATKELKARYENDKLLNEIRLDSIESRLERMEDNS